MVVCAIIQARIGSNRLPGKVLIEISGKPVIALVIDRVKKIKSIEKIIVATTVLREDDKLVTAINNYDPKIIIFRGSADDVLDRYYQTAKANKADTIVRLTGDNTLYDPETSNMIIKEFLRKNLDYCSNSIKRTFPVGLDTEVFSFKALEKTWKETKTPLEREHVTPYLKNKELFKILNVENTIDLSHIRFTLDYPEDLILIKKIYEAFYPRTIFSLNETLAYLEKHPDLKEINKDCRQV
jgi:spore coat polysaccharide biosynthesis protein SpsF